MYTQTQTQTRPESPFRPRVQAFLISFVGTFLAVLLIGCGGGSDADFSAQLSELLDVPVLSGDVAPDWRDEGEPAPKLTKVCPPATQYTVFAENASRVVRRADGANALGGTALLSERGEAPAYTRELFAGAQACAERLLDASFSEQGPLVLAGSAGQVGDESVTLVNADGVRPMGAVFFRRDEFVSAVIVIGGDDASLAQLARLLDEAIVSHERGWELSPAAEQ